MSRTNDDVKELAIAELGIEFSMLSFEDDATFQTYADTVVDLVVDELSDRVGIQWTLENDNLYRAAAFEADARFARRIASRYFAASLQGESITIGPIKIESSKGLEHVAPQLTAAWQMYHRMAEDLLGVYTGGRKGAIKNWTPRVRQVIL